MKRPAARKGKGLSGSILFQYVRIQPPSPDTADGQFPCMNKFDTRNDGRAAFRRPPLRSNTAGLGRQGQEHTRRQGSSIAGWAYRMITTRFFNLSAISIFRH